MHYLTQLLGAFHITALDVVVWLALWSMASTFICVCVTLVRARLYLRRHGDLVGFNHFYEMFQAAVYIVLLSYVGFFFALLARWSALAGS